MQICIDALQPLPCLHVLGLAHAVLFEASTPAVSHPKEIWRVIVQAHVSNQEVAELDSTTVDLILKAYPINFKSPCIPFKICILSISC